MKLKMFDHFGNQEGCFNLDYDLQTWAIGFNWDSLSVCLYLGCFTLIYWRSEIRRSYSEEE